MLISKLIGRDFDTFLEIPSGRNPKQNAWLTLEIKVAFKFADSKHPVTGLTQSDASGNWFAKDHDGWLFPILDWPPFLIERFCKEYQDDVEKTWNYQFVLITPRDYTGLDVTDIVNGVVIRPNLLCLFRCWVVSPLVVPHGPQTPLSGNWKPHVTINVVNLKYGTTQVKRPAAPAADPNKSLVRNTPKMDALTWRSDAANYDDSDLFQKTFIDPRKSVRSDVAGHELGHLLGQDHITCLKLDPKCIANPSLPYAYGVGSSDPLDLLNIMGGGNRIYLINAAPWQKRILQHTATTPPVARTWNVTGIMDTPPRQMALGASLIGTPVF
jgi:hypothetical protein